MKKKGNLCKAACLPTLKFVVISWFGDSYMKREIIKLLSELLFAKITFYINVFPDPNEYYTYLETRPPKMELDAISLITSFLNKTEYV